MENKKLTRRSLTLSLLGFATLTLGPLRSRAQGVKDGQIPSNGYVPMIPFQKGAAPFSETIQDMVARDDQIAEEIRQGIRPAPPAIRWVDENEFIEKVEEEIREKRAKGSSRLPAGPSFPAPPYLGAIDAQGHFISPTSGMRALKEPTPPQGPQVPGTAFDGPNLSNSGFIPPDTQGAVGPNHAVFMVNGRVEFYTKAGASAATGVSLTSFFTVTVSSINYPQGGAFDPRLLYDRPSGRWFATGMEFGVGNTNNHVILAISRTNDPTGTWDKYLIQMGVAARFTDYSTLGVDANGVYFAAGYPGQGVCRLISTPKASLIAASPSLGTVFTSGDINDMFATPQPATNLDGSGGGRAYFVASSTTVFGNINYRTVTWSGNTPSLAATTTVLTTPGYAQNPNAAASGSTTLVNTGDDRILQAMLRNNQLWCARNVGVNSTGGSTSPDRCACEWLVMNVSAATATLAQSGRVFDNSASPFRHYYYGGISVSGQGHAALILSGSRSNEFIGIYTCGRLSSDTNGTMQAILQTRAGVGAYTANDNSGRNRWGDYSYTCVDPNDDQSMWGFTEYPSGTNTWTARVQRLLAPAPTATATAVSVIPGQTNVSLPITGTGIFDPGTGFTNRLAASASGTGISNVRIAYISATQASVTFDVANTATTGTRNITITNPDGQAITINNAINVVAAQPVLAFTRTIINTGSAWRVTLTIKNNGGATASSVRVLTSLLGSTATSTATPIAVGNIAAGASTNVQIDFPLAAATSGVRVVHRVTGDYTGSTFSSSAAVTPP